MRLGLMVMNGLVLAGVAWVALMGPGEQRVSAVLADHGAAVTGKSGAKPVDLGALESEAAKDPSVGSTEALANAYLAREQPGLASAVLERAPVAVRQRPEIAHIYARTLFHRGHAREALAVAEQAADACAIGCPAWLVAATSRQVAFLDQVVAAGIEDPLADPRATRAAYDRSVHEVRLVAMR
jgi:hypothetical protein